MFNLKLVFLENSTIQRYIVTDIDEGFAFIYYAEAVLKSEKLNTQSQQCGAVVQGRSLSPYRLRYSL
ncbi:MAG: hypothetical protein LBK06_06110 [Planctomycetaceae bacterium]|jgi:hypothetical protein|nr:hypothetical protein [Planctomycetaceae bacterium]